MPKQRSLETRIVELEEDLKRLKTLLKIQELQELLPTRTRRKKR